MSEETEIIENKHTGERIVIRCSGEDNGGELLGFDFFARPGGGVPFEHYHAKQSEYFRMVEGELTVVVDGQERVLGPGDEMTLAPGTKHSLINNGAIEAHCYVEYRPALRSEWWFRLIHPYSSKVGREPTMLELAPFLSKGVEIYPANVPRWVARPVIFVAGLLGRLLGKHRAVQKASDEYFQARKTRDVPDKAA